MFHDKIFKYKEGFQKFGLNVKQKKLLDSIESSNKILDGSSNYENEKNKSDQKQLAKCTIDNEKPKSIPILHKKINKNIQNKTIIRKNGINFKNGVISEKPPEKKHQIFERKITRLLQRTMNSKKKEKETFQKTEENLIKTKENFEKKMIEIEKNNNSEKKKADAKKNVKKTITQIVENIIPNKNSNNILFNPNIEENYLNYKNILKDLWLYTDDLKEDFEYDITIKKFQKYIKDFLEKISSKFEILKRETNLMNKYKTLEIYNDGYCSLLSGMDYILKLRQNSFIYKCYFECIHQDLSNLYEELKNFIYLNYLKPVIVNKKSQKKLNSFENFKENSSEKEKVYEVFNEDNDENQPLAFKKKFCLNLAKTLQANYKMTKDKSQQNSLIIHSLLNNNNANLSLERNAWPQNNGIKLLKIIKVCIFITLTHLNFFI